MSKAELSRRLRGEVAGRSTAGLRPATWTAIWQLAGRGTRRGPGERTSWIRTRGSSTPGWRSFPGCRCSGCSTRSKRAGYAGSYGRVRDYVRTVRPRDPVDPANRFETPPGRQGQVDFGSFTLPWGRRHALLVVLGHSRILWLRFYPRQTMAVLIDGLESAFARFGGVPQELLFDQMRAVVLADHRAGSGGLMLNAEFLRFARLWNPALFHTKALLCRPRQPLPFPSRPKVLFRN